MGKMYYTEEEACEKLGCTPAEMAANVREKKLRLFKDGERNMYMATEVDALAPEPVEEEVDLAPVDDEIPLAPETEAPAPAEDTSITSEGISIFDDEDLEIESADPSAATQVTEGITEQGSAEGVGSGSGLLDLTRESDDTSLGEVIDRIDLDEGGEEPAVEETAAPVRESAAPSAVVVAETEVAMDASSGLFSGLVIGTTIVMLVIGAIALAAGGGLVPGFLEAFQGNLIVVLIGALVLMGIFGVIGLLIGKSVAARQRAMEQMSG